MIKKILVSQPQPSSAKSPYYNIAEKHGVELVFRPFIKVEGIDAKEFRKQKVNILDHTAIVFTSRTAVDHFFRLVTELRITVPEDMKYFGISETVALYIQKYVVYRKRKVFFGTTGKLPELIAVMAKHKSENYLIPLSDVHDDHIQKMLDEKNLKHSECVMYRTVSNDFTEDEVKTFDYDMCIFFSPSGISAFSKTFGDSMNDKVVVGTFGPATAKAAHDAGLKVEVEAPTMQHPSMTSALKDFLEKNK